MLDKIMQMLGMGGNAAADTTAMPQNDMNTSEAPANNAQPANDSCKTCGRNDCICQKDEGGNCVNCGCQ